ncbi:hypothetical protein HN031_13820 [Nocardioides sp. zg-1308]|uniref:hypothetical protein n=1 Tax=Nocardioides sp. zg-1308 TaxID=2736253 RepID=UPI00155223D2|nr:hypothetical protein [Nocardioides sp. zg-1308]NPD05764.1 hypothetical protein [Nocardioides sp. zg-1308]
MSTTPRTTSDVEERLRAALAARADLVGPDDLTATAPAPVVPLRSRWASPWVLVAAAAAVLLVLGVVLAGLPSRQRSDDVAPSPEEPRIELPADVGREWQADDLSSVERLDLDGDGTDEEVEFLAEPSKDFDGRTRIETTLSSTGEEAYGIVQLSTTIGTDALDPIDADGDGDQELVLYDDDPSAVGGGGYPLVLDLRDGLLVQAAVEDPDLLVRGSVPVPGEGTEHYDVVRLHDYWVEDGRLWSGRSRNAYAAGNMTLHRPERVVLEAWTWALDDAGVLRASDPTCRTDVLGERGTCEPGEADSLPRLGPAATGTIGEGEQADYGEGFSFTGAVADGALVARVGDAGEMRLDLAVDDPLLNTRQPTGVFYDGASFVVTSASDPALVQVVVQRGDVLRVVEPVGEVPLRDDGDVRTWLTRDGALVTAVADGDAWRTWQWEMVSGTEIAALPTGTVCFDDVEDPATARAC